MGCLYGLSLLFDFFHFLYILLVYSALHLLAHFLCLILRDLSEMGFHSKHKQKKLITIEFIWDVCNFYLETQAYNPAVNTCLLMREQLPINKCVYCYGIRWQLIQLWEYRMLQYEGKYSIYFKIVSSIPK